MRFLKFALLILTTVSLSWSKDVITDLERDVISEINLFRSNPKAYAVKYIKPMLDNSTKEYYYYPSGARSWAKDSNAYETLYEAIMVLSSSNPIPLITISDGMSQGCNDLIIEQSSSGYVGHSSSAKNRIKQYGQVFGETHEILQYGLKSPRDIVLAFLIDDGVSDRGHRKSLLYGDLYRAGVAIGYHPRYKNLCVVTLCREYTPNN